jgi:hypothetical protein
VTGDDRDDPGDDLNVTDDDHDYRCEPNNLGFCRWCGRDMALAP